jgi:nickel transport protein
VLGALVVVAALVPDLVVAHGADVVVTVSRKVEVKLTVVVEATFHSGRPMAGAQVTVFAPDAPEQPWLVGECDEGGRFEFAPPSDRTGKWDIRVMQRGHGGRVAVEVTGEGEAAGPSSVRAEASSTAHLTPLQKTVMAVSVIWGLLGTALFFSRRRR